MTRNEINRREERGPRLQKVSPLGDKPSLDRREDGQGTRVSLVVLMVKVTVVQSEIRT